MVYIVTFHYYRNLFRSLDQLKSPVLTILAEDSPCNGHPPDSKEVIFTKKQSLKPDAVLKAFWQNNVHFADLFNAALFDGQPVLDPDKLLDGDTDLSVIVPDKEHLTL